MSSLTGKLGYGDRVRVKQTGQRAFVGKVYSEYTQPPYRLRSRTKQRYYGTRYICVETPGGAGVGYLVRYVSHVGKTIKAG